MSDNAAPILSPNQIIRDLCNRRRNSDIRADDKELRELLESSHAAQREEIQRLLADLAIRNSYVANYEHATKVERAESDAEIQRLTEERDASRTETAACVEFLETELGWQDFRAEGFIGESAVSSSTRNCQKLRAFLAAKGDHGVKVLAELSALRAELEAVKGESK